MPNFTIRTYAAICLMVLLASCAAPVTLGPVTISPTENTTSVEEAVSSLDAALVDTESIVDTESPAPAQERELTPSVEEQLDTLSYWIGHWRAMRLSGTPSDDAVLQEVMNLLVSSAAVLDLAVDAEALATVDAYDAAEAIVRQISGQVGAHYGITTQATFEVRYATQVADLLLWFVNQNMSAEEIQARSHTAGNYLSAALNSAQNAGLQGPLLTDGLQLARNMARGAEPLEASRDVFMWRIRVLAWLDAEKQAAFALASATGVSDSIDISDSDVIASNEDTILDELIREPAMLYISMGCIDCHYLEEPQDGILLNNLIAPSLGNLPDLAASRIEGLDAVTYVHTSIIDPDAFIVDGYEAGIMPFSYADEMTEAEINALVQWLLDPGRE
jgi:hypothetical protein